MLKTFISEEVLEKRRFVLIVPCDENELAKHLKNNLYIEDLHGF